MFTEEEQKKYEQDLDHYLRCQWFKKNAFALYSCIISTLALIVSIIVLFH